MWLYGIGILYVCTVNSSGKFQFSMIAATIYSLWDIFIYYLFYFFQMRDYLKYYKSIYYHHMPQNIQIKLTFYYWVLWILQAKIKICDFSKLS